MQSRCVIFIWITKGDNHTCTSKDFSEPTFAFPHEKIMYLSAQVFKHVA